MIIRQHLGNGMKPIANHAAEDTPGNARTTLTLTPHQREILTLIRTPVMPAGPVSH
jgi:hypothetical protein